MHDLALDRAGGKRAQRHAALGLIAVDGLHQAQIARLDDVVDREPAAGVATRDRTHERRVAHDQLLAHLLVAGADSLNELNIGKRS